MKTLPLLSALVLLFAAGSALACPRSKERFLCPGDLVIAESGMGGKVQSVNPFKKKIFVKFDGYTNAYEYTPDTLAIASGCLEGYCVGDKVIVESGMEGRIAGVNPYSRQAAIKFDGYSNAYYFSVDDLAVDYGCIEGYCVGDDVTTESGMTGRLVGLNFNNGKGAVKFSGYSNKYLFDIQDLASHKYCETYGEQPRSRNRFPEAYDPSDFATPDFRYTKERPARGKKVPAL